MRDREYKVAYEKGKAELADLVAEKDALEKRIFALRQTLAGLANLCEGGITPIPGARSITEEVRNVLRTAEHGMTARHVRNTLISLGYELGDERMSLAKVHVILSRLVKDGYAETASEVDGATTYCWKRTATRKTIGQRLGEFNVTNPQMFRFGRKNK